MSKPDSFRVLALPLTLGFICLWSTSLALGFWCSGAGDYGVCGELHLSNSQHRYGPTDLLDRDDPWAQLTYCAEVGSLGGPHDNYAIASYVANLVGRYVNVRADAVTAFCDDQDGWVAGIANGQAVFRDTVTFTIPAGHYDQTVYAEMKSHLGGFMDTDTHNGQDIFGCNTDSSAMFDFGIDGHHTVEHVYGSDPFLSLDETIFLSHPLVFGDTTLTEPISVEVILNVRLYLNAGLAKGGSNRSAGDLMSRIIWIDAPEGIGWSSDSGAWYPPRDYCELTLDHSGLYWTDVDGALGYDVVQGSLNVLRETSGNFTPSVEECLAFDHGTSFLDYTDDPDPGIGHWFLVRGVGATNEMTYDTRSPSQVGLRDDEIDASLLACP